MKLLSIFHRNRIKNIPAVSKRDALLVEAADTIIKQNTAKIQHGLNNLTASTGTPMNKLHGNAKRLAQMANVGGGSKATGGGGLEACYEITIQLERADAIKKAISSNTPPKISYKK